MRFVEGVCGNRMRFVEGVCGNKMRFVEGVFKIRFVVGVPSRLDGVTGNGIAKSRSFLLGDFVGEREPEGVGEPGRWGAARMAADAGDLGEDDASRRVRFDGFTASGRAGSSAIGIWGTDFSLA